MSLEKYLGVQLTDPDQRYVVFQNIRINGTARYVSVKSIFAVSFCKEYLSRAQLNPTLELTNDASALPEGTPSEENSNSIINFTRKWGFHTLSAVNFGEILFQVNKCAFFKLYSLQM